MKKQWNKLNAREQNLVVFLVFLLIFGGLYMGISNGKEKNEALSSENQSLVSEQDKVSTMLTSIPTLEKDFENNIGELGVSYEKVQDNFGSPITFERMFQSWLKGRKAKIIDFTVSEPALETTQIDVKNVELSEAEENVSILNGNIPENEELKDEDDNKENTQKTQKKDEVYSILSSLYSYEVRLGRKDFNFILDKVNELSEFYVLERAEYNEETKIGTFAIKVYMYDKPEGLKQYENLEYFYNDIPEFTEADLPKPEKDKETGEGNVDKNNEDKSTQEGSEGKNDKNAEEPAIDDETKKELVDNPELSGIMNNKGENLNTKDK